MLNYSILTHVVSTTDLQAVEQVLKYNTISRMGDQRRKVMLIAYSQHRPEIVEASLDACLAELELDYLDVCSLCEKESSTVIHCLGNAY